VQFVQELNELYVLEPAVHLSSGELKTNHVSLDRQEEGKRR
jgi:hypothetical protein